MDQNRQIEFFRRKINDTVGAEQVLAYISWSNLKEGYYAPNELMKLSLEGDFILDSPYCKIKRGTKISKNVKIKNGSSIDGENVIIGEGTVLDGAKISGSNIKIGRNNTIHGSIIPGNIEMGDENIIREIVGKNEGQFVVGNYNAITEIKIDNIAKTLIKIGNYNDLNKGLSINSLYPKRKIIIRNYNSLGRDGGGVISTSYRFGKGWSGHVLVGDHVETTRGAEILGYSLLGWHLTIAEKEKAKDIFTDFNGRLDEVDNFFESISDREWDSLPQESKDVSFYGIVKSKLCCLTGSVTAKDDTRIQSSFLQDIIIQERCKIFFATVDHELAEPIRVDQQGIAIENIRISQIQDWKSFPTKTNTSGYPKTAEAYFEEHCSKENPLEK